MTPEEWQKQFPVGSYARLNDKIYVSGLTSRVVKIVEHHPLEIRYDISQRFKVRAQTLVGRKSVVASFASLSPLSPLELLGLQASDDENH